MNAQAVLVAKPKGGAVAWWLTQVSDSGSRGRGFEPHSGRQVVSLSKTYLPQKKYWLPPNMTEKLLTRTFSIKPNQKQSQNPWFCHAKDDVYKTLCLQQMLVHKGGQINNVQLITGLRIAEMSQLQNCSVKCTKNGSYCENVKKREKKSGGRGDGYKELKLL